MAWKLQTRILSNLSEQYHIIVENLEDELDDNIDILTIEINRKKLSVR